MMNERIKELADQILPNEKEFHKGDPKDWGFFFSGDELEEFAELIVRECAEQIRYCQKNDIDFIVKHIEKHFGVK
jgi:hypothetical protein